MKQLVISGVCKSEESVEALFRHLKLIGMGAPVAEQWSDVGLTLTYASGGLVLATITPECHRMFTVMVIGDKAPGAYKIFSGSLDSSVFSSVRFNGL